MVWRHWKGDVAAALVGLLLSVVVSYVLGAAALAVSATFRCEDQCQMDRIYGTEPGRR